MSRPVRILQWKDASDEAALSRVVQAATATRRDVLRAEIILMRAAGKKESEAAQALKTSINTVSKWTQRYEAEGLEGLKDAKGRGRKSRLPAGKVNFVLTKVTPPPKGQSRWSVRSMAKAAGVSRHSVHQLWQKNGLKPHRTKTFKLSNDPRFEEKFWMS